MPIIQCTCGKRITAGDALVGKSVRCPQCKQPVLVTAGSAGPAPAGKPAAKATGGGGASFAISGGMVATIVLLVLGFTIVIGYKIGPGKVAAQWDTLGPKAAGEVNDVVTFAIQAHLSEIHEFNPSKGRNRPAVDGPVNFLVPHFVMNMPEKLPFFGMTTQGKFTGFYHTASGEMEADIAYGGRTVAALVQMNKSTGQFHITGRDVNGTPEAEMDGEKLKIVYPPKDEDE